MIELSQRSTIKPPNPKDLDLRLKQWANGYCTHDRREISTLTGGNCAGSLGLVVKKHNKPNNIYDCGPIIEIDDSEYRRLNAVVLSLNVYNRMVLHRHYITRKDYLEKHISGGVTPKRASEMFLDKLGMTSSNIYTVDLNDAKHDFHVRGGG
jgi:hypothetical protein